MIRDVTATGPTASSRDVPTDGGGEKYGMHMRNYKNVIFNTCG